jgi:hypothetical protein
MADGITKGEMRDLLIEQAKLLKGGNSSVVGSSSTPSSSGGGSSSGSLTGVKEYDDRIKAAIPGYDKMSSAFTGVSDTAKDLKNVVVENLGVWRDLGKTGANFGNDMVALKTAQVGSRVSMDEFTDTIKKNNTSFIGLGGNVSKGAENFAKLTNEMYTNYAPVTDSLRQQGITNKELNDTLALQIGMQRGTFKDNKEGHEESIRAATDLAEQMNKTAILTGKSRQQQEEALKEASVNQMVEGKMRLIGASQGPEAEAKARKEFLIQQQQADARGQGQYFKEVFAAGHAITQGAAMQQATLGKQAIATAEQARATARGDSEAANKFNQQAREEQLANTKNVAMAQAAIYSEGNSAYAKQAAENNKATQPIYDARLKLEQDENFRKLSTADQLKQIDKQVAEDAAAKKASGEEAAGAASTKAAVNIEQRFNDAGAAVMKNLVTPLNEKAGPAIGKFADEAVGATQKLSDGKVVTTPQANNLAVKQGMEGTAGTPGTARPTGLVNQGLNVVGGLGRAGVAAGGAFNAAGEWIKNATSSEPPKKAEGGIVPGTDKGTTVTVGEKGKPEAIVPLDQLKQDKAQGVNVAEISKTISTTISSAQGPSNKVPSMADLSTSMSKMGMTDSQKKLFDEFSSLNAKNSQEKLASLKEEENSAKAANKAAMLARDAIEEKAELEDRKLTAAEEAQFKALGKELNSSYDKIRAAEDAQKVLAKVEENKKSQAVFAAETVSKVMEDAGIKQLESVKKSTDEQSSLLTDYQKTTLKYAYTDTEGKQMQLENAKKLVESEKNTIADKNKQLEEIQAAADGRELTNREKSRIERLQKEIESSKETLSYREQDLEVYANLDKLKGETEIKSVNDTAKEQISAQEIAKNRLEAILKEGSNDEMASKEEAMKALELATSGPAAELSKRMKADQEKITSAATAIKPPSLEEMKAQFAKMSTSMDADPAKLKELKGQIDSKTQSMLPDFGGFGGKDGDKGIPSFLANLNSQISKAEIKKPEEKKTTAGTTAQAVKKEEPKKPETPAKQEEKTTGKVEQVSLKDLHTSLEHLNKSMAKLITYSEQTATAAQAQIKATKSLSGNKFA